MKEIILSNGWTTQVDDVDYLYLNQFNWWPHGKGYAQTRIDGSMKLMHRVVMGRMGLGSCVQVDHEDRNKLNNQRYNLRASSNRRNQHNQGLRACNSSGYVGVSFDKRRNKFAAYYRGSDGTKILVGHYSTPEEAHNARESKMRR